MHCQYTGVRSTLLSEGDNICMRQQVGFQHLGGKDYFKLQTGGGRLGGGWCLAGTKGHGSARASTAKQVARMLRHHPHVAGSLALTDRSCQALLFWLCIVLRLGKYSLHSTYPVDFQPYPARYMLVLGRLHGFRGVSVHTTRVSSLPDCADPVAPRWPEVSFYTCSYTG